MLVEIELVVQLDTQELHGLAIALPDTLKLLSSEWVLLPVAIARKFSRVCLHLIVVKPFQSYFTFTFNFAFEDNQLSMYKTACCHQRIRRCTLCIL